MTTHLFLMLLFAFLVSLVLAALLRASARERVRYVGRSFGLFVAVGLGIAWILFPFSR